MDVCVEAEVDRLLSSTYIKQTVQMDGWKSTDKQEIEGAGEKKGEQEEEEE